MTEVLAVRGLHAGYSRRAPIVHGVDVDVAAARTLAVLGPNGSGKSTLLKSVLGLTVLHRGSIRFGERELAGLPSHQMPRLGLGYVPQQDAVFPRLSVRENLAVSATGRRNAIARRIDEVLDVLPLLRKRIATAAGALSGGEQRLVAIGRALVPHPRMLLLDEPTAGLAPKAGADVLDQVDQIREELGLGILLVEQNARAAVQVADDVLVLAAGEVAFRGTRDEAVADDQLAALYLGQAQ